MNQKQQRELSFGTVLPFDMKITYAELTRDVEPTTADSHVHPECEIYICLSGDVSFMVEQQIYPILPGSIVITRPYEYHHCIYHSDEPHKHFWILFSANGNESLLPRFFERENGERNLLVLSADGRRELFALCHSMIDEPLSEAERQYCFFRLLNLLDRAEVMSDQDYGVDDAMSSALAYLDEHFCDSITVRELASVAHVSVNTLERHFQQKLHMTPMSYLKKKRLAHAAACLYEGCSVSEACEKSGFSDYSHFIALFKKTYGMTPLKYKKEVTGN